MYCHTGSTKVPLKRIIFSIGLFGLGSQDDQKAKYQEASKKLAKTDQVTLLLKHAKLEESKHNFEEAEKYYREALVALKQQRTWTKDKSLDAHIFIHSSMANLAMTRSHFNKAEILFKETMHSLLQKGIKKNDNAFVEISLKLAMIYAVQQHTMKAESGYCFCIETLEKTLKNNTASMDDSNTRALLGLCVDSYGRFLLVQKRYLEAEQKLKDAMGIAIHLHGQYHPQVAVLLNDIATVQSLRNDYIQAKVNIHKAVYIARRSDSTDLPTFLCNLGLVCLQQNLFDEAKKHCSHALFLLKKSKQIDTESNVLKCLESAEHALKVKQPRKTG